MDKCSLDIMLTHATDRLRKMPPLTSSNGFDLNLPDKRSCLSMESNADLPKFTLCTISLLMKLLQPSRFFRGCGKGEWLKVW